MQLNTSTLPRLAVAKPGYDRDRIGIGIGIVHFGVGGFHRRPLGHSRISMTQDRYMARGRVHTAVADLLDRTINDE